MPTYDVTARCKDCGIDHPVLLSLHIDEGPDRKQSITESFRGRIVPPQVAAIRSHKALCPKTGRKFPLDNDSETFLVPLGNLKLDPPSH